MGEAYCKEYPEGEQPLWVTLIQKVLLTWLPPVLLMLWQIVLMRVLYYIAAAEGRNIALSMIDRRIISLYFYWDFFNVFLGGVIGSAGITLLVQNFNDVDLNQVLILFGRAIMSNSNFFISYVSLRALLMVPFKLLFPHPAVLCWTLRNLLSKTYCCATRCNLTFRDKYVIWAPKSFMYGKESGIFLLIAMMGAIYAVSAPLILVFAAIYFSFAFIVFKHHLLYVYGGADGHQVRPVAGHRFAACPVPAPLLHVLMQQAVPQPGELCAPGDRQGHAKGGRPAGALRRP